MNLILTAPPAAEPVSLAEAKAWLRIDTASEDASIAALIASARTVVEAATRRALVTQGWRLILDGWPDDGADGSLSTLATRPVLADLRVDIPLAPLASVGAIRVYDAGGQPQTLPSGAWRLADAPEHPRLAFVAPPPQPGVKTGGIEIDLVAGYGAAADVPAPLRQAILMLVADWYENRGDAEALAPHGLPRRVAALVAPWRRGRLA